MIILVATAELTQQGAVEASREAIEAVGGTLAAIDLSDPELVRINCAVPGMGVPAFGSYLASGGVQLDPAAETVLSGASAGFLASNLSVTLIVRLDGNGPDLEAG
jgi:hypothetical protein